MKTMMVGLVILLSMLISMTDAVAANGSNISQKKTKHLNLQLEDAVDYLKAYPVNKIESAQVNPKTFVYRKLPQTPLEKWLTSILVGLPLEWEKKGCSSYDSSIESNPEHCVSYLVTVRTPLWRCPEIYFSFAVETDGSVDFLNDFSRVNDFAARDTIQQLAELKESLDKVIAETAPNRPASLPAASLKSMPDSDLINYARAIDVHSLDPSLLSERLDQWLFNHTAGFPQKWGKGMDGGDLRCGPKRIMIGVGPEKIPNTNRPPYGIFVYIGSMEHGIESKPTLNIYYEESGNNGSSNWIPLNNLSALQKKLDEWDATLKKANEWNASIAARKSMAPWWLTQSPTPSQASTPPEAVPSTKAPVVQNITKLGDFSRVRSTSAGHCYGIELSLWQYGKQVFGTLFDPDGQCADSQAPTYVVRDAKYDPATGKIEFWSYGTPGYKFVGKMDEKMIRGQFIGMPDLFDEKDVILKRSRGYFNTFLETEDSNKNVEVWCKEYAPKLRLIEKEGLDKLCKSLGVK